MKGITIISLIFAVFTVESQWQEVKSNFSEEILLSPILKLSKSTGEEMDRLLDSFKELIANLELTGEAKETVDKLLNDGKDITGNVAQLTESTTEEEVQNLMDLVNSYLNSLQNVYDLVSDNVDGKLTVQLLLNSFGFISALAALQLQIP